MEDFIKITDELIKKEEIYSLEKLQNFICDSVYNIFERKQFSDGFDYSEVLVECESPIEQLLAAAIYEIGLYRIHKYNPFIDFCIANQQELIMESGNKYRVDFYIIVRYENQEPINKYLVIECDGYEYHSTKEQIKKDNERQRELQKNGYEVIRFSGSEIYKNPYACANEILDIILSGCQYNKGKQNG